MYSNNIDKDYFNKSSTEYVPELCPISKLVYRFFRHL